MRVLVAMSGGVDSSVAAARLVADGHEVTGVHLALNRNPELYRSGSRGCCSLEDSHDARRVADTLGIPFYVWDFSERFHADVVEDFVAEYAAGRTPNPCLRCNEKIKFAAVLERGVALGFDAVATGHYARLERSGDEALLHRAADAAKDQSYVLGVLTQEQLRRSLFPLYGTVKADVRAEAEALGLRVASKPDSHDICFISDGDTAGFLTRALGERPGAIVDTDGAVVGEHAGTHRFTVGQRRGLRLGVPATDGQPPLRPGHLAGDQHGHRRAPRGPGGVRDRGHPAHVGGRRPPVRHLARARAGARPRRGPAGHDRGGRRGRPHHAGRARLRHRPRAGGGLYDGDLVVGASTIAGAA